MRAMIWSLQKIICKEFYLLLSFYRNWKDAYFVDYPMESLRNLTRRIDIGNPFDKIEELTTFLQNIKDFTSDSEDSSDDNDNEIDDNYYLKSNRVPISVYKYPVDGSFGSIFQGFETVKDEVLDLSKASQDELKEYYSLPRSFWNARITVELSTFRLIYWTQCWFCLAGTHLLVDIEINI